MLSLYLQSIIVSLFLFLFIKTIFWRTKNKKLPPGPPALPVLGHLHLLKGPLHHSLGRISQKYGPISYLRFGSRPALVISSSTLAEECFTQHDLILANRPRLPSFKHVTFDYTLVSAANYGPYWRNTRRVTAVELLSSQSLHASSPVRAGEVQDMTRRLFTSWKNSVQSKNTNERVKVGLKQCLFQISLNVLMKTITGKRFYGDNIEDFEEMSKFRKRIEDQFAFGNATNIEDFIPPLRLLDMRGLMKVTTKLSSENKVQLQKLIEDNRRNGDLKTKTMMKDLLKLQEKDPDAYNDDIIQALALTFILGGTDTTSNTLEWAMTLLLNHPDVLKRVVAEIVENVGSERLFKESDMANLPFLHCVLSEVLRLYPGLPLLGPHEPSEDITIQGYDIPRGTIVFVNAYYIHRDPEIWEEPMKFKPERFENGKAHGKWMIPFGMGRRRCPGEGLAMRELGLILGTLLQCFEWERISDELIDLTEGSGLTVPKVNPLEALYRPRESMINVLSSL